MKYYRSLITGNKYSYKDYCNHGWGGIKKGKKDLPNEYPYTITYDNQVKQEIEKL